MVVCYVCGLGNITAASSEVGRVIADHRNGVRERGEGGLETTVGKQSKHVLRTIAEQGRLATTLSALEEPIMIMH